MGEDERDSSSSMMIFKGLLLLSRDGRIGVKLRPRTWPWRLRVTSRVTRKKKTNQIRNVYDQQIRGLLTACHECDGRSEESLRAKWAEASSSPLFLNTRRPLCTKNDCST